MHFEDGTLQSGTIQSDPCPHRPPCPGCPRFGERGLAPAPLAALEDLAQRHGLATVTVVDGPYAGFRHRARLAIRGRTGTPKVGLFELGTHRVVQVPNCIVHHPLINRVASVVRRALADARVACYSDKAHQGIARYLQVVIERSSGSAQVVLVANSETPEPLGACFELIRERLGSELHSLWFNAQRTRSNVIVGSEFERRSGPPAVIEHFGGAAIHYPPGAFGQSNLEVAARIIEEVRTQVPEGSRVTELYAGVGAIGLSILDRARELRLNESSPASLAGLELGIEALDAGERERIAVLGGNAEGWREAASECDVLIVDPPRKGLGAPLSDHLAERPPARLLYVSCGLDSFLEDTARLIGRGKLRLASLMAFNLFPYTDHIETLARFERA
jgi:23S rRNA (uracil1939-C5)-methyltransferase